MFWFFNGKFDNAVRYLEHEVNLFPTLTASRMPLSAALAKAGEPGEAIRHLSEALGSIRGSRQRAEAMRRLEGAKPAGSRRARRLLPPNVRGVSDGRRGSASPQ